MISENKIDALREKVSASMSEYRFIHTAEVEKMAARLGLLYAPDAISSLRAAALLHDITKELSTEAHMKLCEEHGIALSEAEKRSPKTLHAITAAAVIPERYPEFATEEIILAVRWHTTGRAGMSLYEKLIFLSDYIDMSRKFEDCIKVREFFFGACPENMTEADRLLHLDRTIIFAFDLTIASLIEEGAFISPDTVSAREHLAKMIGR